MTERQFAMQRRCDACDHEGLFGAGQMAAIQQNGSSKDIQQAAFSGEEML
jgi:hypothetical protein